MPMQLTKSGRLACCQIWGCYASLDHFADVSKMVKLGSGKRTKIGFIDKIVKTTRFSGWQKTHSGGRETAVKKNVVQISVT